MKQELPTMQLESRSVRFVPLCKEELKRSEIGNEYLGFCIKSTFETYILNDYDCKIAFETQWIDS